MLLAVECFHRLSERRELGRVGVFMRPDIDGFACNSSGRFGRFRKARCNRTFTWWNNLSAERIDGMPDKKNNNHPDIA